ncbi:MAG: leucine-rich repeat domain-containing protein [Clostridia bacterium]|nr:leucine-rich repeat domain-containing protein [Clostridia bacterium]
MNNKQTEDKKSRTFPVVLSFLLICLCVLLSACGASGGRHVGTVEEVPLTPDTSTVMDFRFEDHLGAAGQLLEELKTAPEEDFTVEPVTLDGTDGVSILSYNGTDSHVRIPDRIGGFAVLSIGPEAFSDNVSLEGLAIPSGVKSVSPGCLQGANRLVLLSMPTLPDQHLGALFGAATWRNNRMYIPSSLLYLCLSGGESISEYQYAECIHLKAVLLPDTLEAMEACAFYGCTDLEEIRFPERMERIGERAFLDCRGLHDLILPDLQSAGQGILEGCMSVRSLSLPFLGKENGDGETAFLAFTFGSDDVTWTRYIPESLEELTLRGGTCLFPMAFYRCTSLRTLHLPPSLEEIGDRALAGCEMLRSLDVPDSVSRIGAEACKNCLRLTQVNLPQGLSELGIQCFMECISLSEITLPDSLTSIPNGCFADCSALREVHAGAGIETGAEAFAHTPLSEPDET